ncbi:MAG: amidohydrolase [Oscillospiraceae bacterium]|nr:amidohydrolase [Oscillospiraceae bacterium]
MSYLIKNCDLAELQTLGYSRCDLRIDGDRIKEIAPHIDRQPADTVVDARGMLALPAFVDCHCHAFQSFSKGYMDDYPITRWLVRMGNFHQYMKEEDYYYAALLSCLEGMRFGTTTINEMICDRAYVDAEVQAFRDAGMRLTIGIGNHTDVVENEKTSIKTIDECLRESEDIYQKYNGIDADMVRTCCAPAGLPAVSRELMQALKQFARERGLILHTHLAEGKQETENVRRREGMWECECLYEFGVLDEKTLLAHSIWLQDYELDLIKKSGANPVHCPNTNMKISDGIPKIHQMLQRGINVTLGCDGEASSSTRDMIREARAGAYLQKAATLDATAMDMRSAYRMMTANGARALGYADLGELRTGGKADLLLIDTSKDVALVNRATRLSNLLYAGTGHAVDTVFANGHMTVRGGEFVSLDAQAILEKCEQILARIDRQFSIQEAKK